MPKIVQRVRTWNSSTHLWILVAIALVFFTALGLAPRVAMWPGYHDFADQRTIFGIPHSFDVLSNLPFFLVGLWSLALFIGNANRLVFRETRERIPYLIFFAGVMLTGIGSGYYHLAPDNSRLIWDLLPMSLSFVSILDATILERISVKLGLWLLLPLLVLGAASVCYWYFGELWARGDMRFYLFVQFFPVLAIPAIILLFPPEYSGIRFLMIAFSCYVVAKLFELFDRQIYAIGHIVSGHTLKHVTAGIACYWILRMLQLRSVIFEQSAEQRRPRTAPLGAVLEETASWRPS